MLSLPRWAPGHAPIQRRFSPGQDDEQIRLENENADELKGWFPLELRWRVWSLRPFRSTKWILDLSPDTMRLEHSVAGRRTIVCEIARGEAGELAIETVQYGRVPWFSMVAGWSINGASTFVLPDRRVSPGGITGQFQRVSVGQALVSWWPLNSRSRDGLLAFEGVANYWNPSGLSVGPRVMREDEYLDLRLNKRTPPGR